MIYLVLLNIGKLIFRRGTGIFKFLFAVDDLIRLFTMTLVFFFLLSAMDASKTVVLIGSLFGLVIDIHDVFDDLKTGKPVDFGFG